ncbi:unnamed protein product, partial [Polarella glacialis]
SNFSREVHAEDTLWALECPLKFSIFRGREPLGRVLGGAEAALGELSGADFGPGHDKVLRSFVETVSANSHFFSP